MRQYFLFLLRIVLLFSIINSCINEDFSVSKIDVKNYQPSLAIPVIDANLDLNDLSAIDSAGWGLHEDAGGFMTLVYVTTQSYNADSFLKISNQTMSRNYIYSIDNSLPVGDSITDTYTSVLDFSSPENDIFDLIYVKSGSLEVKISGDLNWRGRMVFRLPGVTNNGQMIVSGFNYTGVPVNHVIDISGCVISFFHFGNTNRLLSEFDVTAYNDGLPNFSPYNINIDVVLNNLKFNKVFGYFSPRSFNFKDHMRISLFGGVVAGTSYFEDPKLNLNFMNSVGIPVDLNILQFMAHSDLTPPYNVDITGLPNPIHIAAPQIPGDAVYQKYILSKANSNIKDVINMVPTSFDYDIDGKTLSDPSHQNFIFDTSKIKVDVEIELPLYGRVRNYILEETFDFTIDNLERFESVNFNLLFGNGFPLESFIQIYFLDENKQVLDSLFEFPKDYIRSAVVDLPTGRVIKPSSRLYKVEFDRNRLDMILGCKYVKVNATLNTTNNGKTSIRIFSDYKMDIKLSVLAKLKKL